MQAPARTRRRRRDPSVRAGSRARVFERCSSPSVLARRFAGSMVTTTVSRPRRAPSMASAAAVVVLPTPPVPQQIDDVALVDDVGERHGHRSCRARRRDWRRPRSSSSASMLDLGRPDVGGEEERQPDLREREPFARAARTARPGACADRRGTRPRRRASATLAVGERRARLRRVGADAVELVRARRRSGASGVTQPFTTIGPSATPARSSIAYAVSTSSLTGVSSGSVTSITWQRAGSLSSSTTSAACLWTGPTVTASSSPRAESRKRDRVPGGGRVEHDQVGDAGPLELLHLAQHEDVPHAGHRGGDDVERARPTEALRDPSHTVVVEVVEQGVVGGERARPQPRSELRFLVGERGLAEARREPRFALDLDDQHAHARAGRCGGQRGGHRRLADPTLARHDHDPGGRAEALEVHGHRCYGSPHHAPRAPPRSRCSRSSSRVAVLALDAVGGRGDAAGRPARHRRRPGRGLPRRAERRRWCTTRSAKRTSSRLDAARSCSSTRRARSTPTSNRRARRSSARGCRSRCGSARRAPTPRARRRSCSRRRHLAYVSPGSGAGPGQPVRLDDPARAPRPASPRGSRRWPRRNGRDPDGAAQAGRRAARARAAASRVGATNGVRPTVGELIVSSTARPCTTAAGAGEALDRQGHRHRPRPPPPAQPGGRASTGSASATRCCTA